MPEISANKTRPHYQVLFSSFCDTFKPCASETKEKKTEHKMQNH